jgi:catechol 2,3-dioxygenase-like lactoylglutathione lyase family enzyme
MVHHVALEVRPDLMAAEGKFWVAAGFEPVAAPEGLGAGFDWYEREGTQIHVMAVGQPGEPSRRGHVAIVAPDFEATLARLGEEGFEVSETRNLWGARRAKGRTPAGHLVELMESPPRPAEAG